MRSSVRSGGCVPFTRARSRVGARIARRTLCRCRWARPRPRARHGNEGGAVPHLPDPATGPGVRHHPSRIRSRLRGARHQPLLHASRRRMRAPEGASKVAESSPDRARRTALERGRGPAWRCATSPAGRSVPAPGVRPRDHRAGGDAGSPLARRLQRGQRRGVTAAASILAPPAQRAGARRWQPRIMGAARITPRRGRQGVGTAKRPLRSRKPPAGRWWGCPPGGCRCQ